MCRGPSSPNAAPWLGRSDIGGLIRFATRAGQFGQPRPAIGGDAAANPQETTALRARAVSGKDFAIRRAVMRHAATGSLASHWSRRRWGHRPRPILAGGRFGGALAAALPGATTGGTRTSARRRSTPGRRSSSPSSTTAAPPAASRLRRRRVAGQRRHLRLPLRRRRRGTQPKRAGARSDYGDESDGVNAAGRACRSIRFPTRRSRSRTGSKAARRATSSPAAIGTC